MSTTTAPHSKPEQIWMQLLEKFLAHGMQTPDDLARLNALSHLLLRTIPFDEANALLPTLASTCAVCHVQGQPDGPRCEHHQFTDSTVVIYLGDDGTGVALCGDCKKRVEQLTAEAEAQNPSDLMSGESWYKPIRTVN